MTNTELISKIKAEIERLHAQHSSKYGTDEAGLVLERLEDFLSTLKSEKPMEHKDIDTEIGHWMGHLDDKYCMLVNHYSIQDIKDTARHFAHWGAEHLKQ